MLSKLPKNDFHRVRDLFLPLRFQLFPAAVINGLLPGEIYVDDVKAPRSAFLLTRDVWGYLAGDPSNSSFNQALNTAINQQALTVEGSWGFLLSCSRGWDESLDEVLNPVVPIEMERRHYLGRKPPPGINHGMPEGYRLAVIDKSLLEGGMELPEDVLNLIQSWDAVLDPAQQGFGFVALHGGEIAAHAVIDVIVGTVGDTGLETKPEHQRHGLATLVSAVAVDYGFNQRGLDEVLWDCGKDNLGSRRIAEELGFEFAGVHKMYIYDYLT
jgi:GNAT superfamily N-acetyltransferase